QCSIFRFAPAEFGCALADSLFKGLRQFNQFAFGFFAFRNVAANGSHQRMFARLNWCEQNFDWEFGLIHPPGAPLEPIAALAQGELDDFAGLVSRTLPIGLKFS